MTLPPPAHIETCVNCARTTATPVLIRWIEGNSGPGWAVYACPVCAPAYLSEATAWRMAFEHAAGCQACHDLGACPMGGALLLVHQTVRRTPGPPLTLADLTAAVPPDPGRDG
jgi:hypothetical protein